MTAGPLFLWAGALNLHFLPQEFGDPSSRGPQSVSSQGGARPSHKGSAGGALFASVLLSRLRVRLSIKIRVRVRVRAG